MPKFKFSKISFKHAEFRFICVDKSVGLKFRETHGKLVLNATNAT